MQLQTHPGSRSILASLGRAALVAASGLLLAPCLGAGARAAAQTTSTLAAETGNNTSASSFPQHDNGNVVAGNVSKLDTHTLLYPGATTSVYAHYQPWFCMPGSGSPIERCNGHILTGYNSNDATTVSNQVTDMISRGIQGVIIDWYGSGAAIENGTSLKIMAEGQSRSPVFQFAIMEDKGAAQRCMNATGQSETQCVISDLNYVASTYYPSPAYMTKGGRPVVFFFIDPSDPVDWNAVRSGVSGNPLFVFQDDFNHTQTDGAFSWVQPGINNSTYLDGFYGDAQAATGKHPFGSTSKGFDDRDASWGTNRFLDQQCGTTWLQLAAQVSAKGYSSSNQLESFQLVTWNDYDEGTEIESGIDNCLSISASISGNTLSWTLSGSGQESTVDRYRVWSTPASDGQNLTLQREVTAGGAHSLDLTTLALTSGTTYTIYVQAVGKPSVLNHMANGVGYTAGPGGPARSVTITSPADGSASTSPVHVVASESTGTSTDMQIYLDGALVFDQPNVHAIDTQVSAAVGSHAIAVKAWYADGTDVLSTVNVTVNSGGTRGVTVTSPAAGASVASPVSVSGFENSGTAVDMQIYLDGGLVYDRPNVQSITAQIAMGAGSHEVAVKAWYADGTDLYTTVAFTVTSGSARGVTVTSPVSGSSSASPVHVVGYENSGTAIDMQIYLDGGLVYDRANVQSLDAHISMGAGSHSITVKSWYADGTDLFTTVSVNVTSGSPRGVTITGPLDGTSVSSPVHVVAYEDSDSAIDMQVYVDGALVFDQANIESVDTRLTMASGTRYVVVKSWYADGTNLSSAVSITVN